MKSTIYIRLKNIDDVKKFIDICNQFEDMDIDYIVGRYSIDAKSIMGVLSVSLGRRAKIEINKAEQKTINLFCDLIQDWIVEVQHENKIRNN